MVDLKQLWAELHLRHICPSCPVAKQLSRDINDEGACYWNTQWSRGNYDIPIVMGRWWNPSDRKWKE